jgi:hypothetical protein
MIEFDLEKHFTSILRILLVVAIFSAILLFFLTSDINLEINNGLQLDVITYRANDVIAGLMFNILLGTVGFIIVVLGLSVLKVACAELKEWKN